MALSSLFMDIPVLSWIVALFAQSSLSRETFIQIIVYQNTLLFLCLITWLIRRLKTYSEYELTLPVFHSLSTKPGAAEPIMILVTKSVTTKVEQMPPLPSTEAHVESLSSPSSSQSHQDTFCH